MNGIVINIDPVAFSVGHFDLRWYSVFVVLAFVAGTMVAVKRCKKIGMTADQVYNLVMVVALSGNVGARLFHVLDRLGYYMENPGLILGFGGLAIWGGLIGGGVATLVYTR